MPTQVRAALAHGACRRGALEVDEPCVCPLGDGQTLERLLTRLFGIPCGDDGGVLPSPCGDGRPLGGEPDLRLALRWECVRR